MVYVLDTHALIWFLEGSHSLSSRARHILKETDNLLILPTIVLAETKYLASRRKVKIAFSTVLELLETDQRLMVYPLDLNVLQIMPTSLEIHDAIICGTAMMYEEVFKEPVAVLTKDEEIRKSGFVKTVW